MVENYLKTVANLAYWCSIEEFFYFSYEKTRIISSHREKQKMVLIIV